MVPVTAVPLSSGEGADIFARYASRHRTAAKFVLHGCWVSQSTDPTTTFGQSDNGCRSCGLFPAHEPPLVSDVKSLELQRRSSTRIALHRRRGAGRSATQPAALSRVLMLMACRRCMHRVGLACVSAATVSPCVAAQDPRWRRCHPPA